jgi:DNA-binding beta-propeller fold protein YncE
MFASSWRLAATVVAVTAAMLGTVPAQANDQADTQPTAAVEAPPARTVYVTNGGTANISTFAIGPQGDLARLGPLVATGDQPRGIALSPDGRTAYVVSNVDETGQLGTYAVGERGELTQLGQPATTGESPFGIAVAPNGRTLYLAHHDEHGTVAAFTIGRGGIPTPLGRPVPTEGTPNGVAVSPDGRFLFVTEGAPLPDEAGRLFTFSIAGDGALTPRGGPIALDSAGEGVTVTPDGRFVYVTAVVTHQVYGFRLAAGGALTQVPGSPFEAPSRPVGVTPTPDGRHLYVTVGEFGTKPNGVWAFGIGLDGSLGRIANTPFESGAAPIWASATPDGRRLYAVNRDSNDVSDYDIAAGGALRQVPGSPAATGGTNALFQSIVVRPNQGPHAAFTAAVAGPYVRFDATSATDADGRIARYDWNFGDGPVLPDGGPTPTHTYRGPGPFTVTLTVTDDEGCSTRQVFTGQTALCNGSPAATIRLTVQ